VIARETFELAKWYGDLVTGEGEVLIAYSGRLRRGRLAVRYESLLSAGSAAHSLRRSRISCSEDLVEWRAPGLKLCAQWRRCLGEIRETVFQSAEGLVEWHCVMPKAVARAERPGHDPIEGLGYLEHLRITIPPWRLPIRRLRWGRYLSANHAVVWIDWEGDARTRLAFRNGLPAAAAAIENQVVAFTDGARLELDGGLVLRRGTLGSTVLHAIPGLERLAPSRIFLVDECKWRSRGRLVCAGKEIDQGWCIHEEVTWP
jgi:hypothetical protein